MDYSKMTKVQLGRELVTRKLVGSASFFTGSSLKWDTTAEKWTGKPDYGPEGLGRFSRQEMIDLLNGKPLGDVLRDRRN